MRTIDLFAGGGGFTCGAEQAGARVLWAANHYKPAVDCHEANHPHVQHKCQDLHQADWSQVPACDLVLASPCCQGHSNARGKDSPQHDASRSTAWAVVSCCEFHNPEAFVVENVPEFTRWKLYPAWRSALEALGYTLTENVIDAADVGLPQHRVRLFIVGARKAIAIDEPGEVWTPVSEVLDFADGNWSPIFKPGRSPATIKRWESGRARFGDRFVMPYYSQGSGTTGRSLDRPLGTVRTKDGWALVDGEKMRMLTVAEYRRIMGFPEDYVLPKSRTKAIHLLGNAVPPPLAKYVVGKVIAGVRPKRDGLMPSRKLVAA